VDLFFFFDATTTQQKEIDYMLNSAKEIVRQFAGDSNNKDICHVGSALFQGPTARLMCGQQVADLTVNCLYSETVLSGYPQSAY
jgi:hypothetical protein